MTIELMPEPTNVVRFPVEKRVTASIDVVRSLEPDHAGVRHAADGFFLGRVDQNVRDRTMTEASAYLSQHVHALPPEALDQHLHDYAERFLTAAVDACRAAEAMAQRNVAAHEAWYAAKMENNRNLAILERIAGDLLEDTARLLILAHYRCEEAHGVNEAINTARRTDFWSPAKMAETTEWLVAAGETDAKRRATMIGRPR